MAEVSTCCVFALSVQDDETKEVTTLTQPIIMSELANTINKQHDMYGDSFVHISTTTQHSEDQERFHSASGGIIPGVDMYYTDSENNRTNQKVGDKELPNTVKISFISKKTGKSEYIRGKLKQNGKFEDLPTLSFNLNPNPDGIYAFTVSFLDDQNRKKTMKIAFSTVEVSKDSDSTAYTVNSKDEKKYNKIISLANIEQKRYNSTYDM